MTTVTTEMPVAMSNIAAPAYVIVLTDKYGHYRFLSSGPKNS